MRYYILFILILSGLLNGLIAQGAGGSTISTIDSLKRVITSAKNDTAKVNLLIRLSNEFYEKGETQNAIKYAGSALEISEQLGFEKGIANSTNILGIVCRLQGKYPKALAYFRRGLKVFEKLKDSLKIEKEYSLIGNVYEHMGNYPQALFFYQKSLKISEINPNNRRIANALNSIGNIHFKELHFDKALEYYQKSLTYIEKSGNKASASSILNNIGNIYSEQGELDKALEYYQRCLHLEEEKGDQAGVVQTLGNIGNVFEKKRKYDEALTYYLKSYKIQEHLDDAFGASAVHINLCNIYIQLKQFPKAQFHGRIALQKAQQMGHLEMMRLSAMNLMSADSALGDYAAAYRHLRLFQIYSDSLTNADKSREMGRLEAQYKYEKQLEEHKRQQAVEAERRTYIYYLFIGGFVFTLITIGILYLSYRSKVRNNRLLSVQNNQIRQQKEDIDHKTRKIEDSIRYAYQIQTAILPNVEYLTSVLPQHFIYYQPKDIVSGDFYWASKKDNLLFICVADCTGHGVPGAFMSVVGSNALHSAVNEHDLTRPDLILMEADSILRRTLHQEINSESKDGMDISFCVINQATFTLHFAGAGRPLYFLRNGELTEIKGDKFPVGGGQYAQKTYTAHEISLQKGDRIYLFSDGVTDQFGGPDKKKFTPKRLKEFILLYQFLPIEKQGQVFRQEFGSWMYGMVQLDDLSFIGIEV